MINVVRFTVFFSLYAVASIIIALTVAFTSAAWIIYAFTLLPFYLIYLLYCLSICSIDRSAKLKLKPSAWYAILCCQLLFVITSPADCYMWNQGRACYSFIQAYLDCTSLEPPHWAIESIFPIALLAYMILIIKFSIGSRIHKQIDN